MNVVWEGCANPKMGASDEVFLSVSAVTSVTLPLPHAFLMEMARQTAQPNPSQSQANDPEGEDDEAEKDPTQLFGVLVHVRSFLKFLNSHVVSTTTIACTSSYFLYLPLLWLCSLGVLTNIDLCSICSRHKR